MYGFVVGRGNGNDTRTVRSSSPGGTRTIEATFAISEHMSGPETRLSAPRPNPLVTVPKWASPEAMPGNAHLCGSEIDSYRCQLNQGTSALMLSNDIVNGTVVA